MNRCKLQFMLPVLAGFALLSACEQTAETDVVSETASVELPNGLTVKEQIEARQGHLKKIGKAFKAISDQLKAGSPDLAQIQTAAATVPTEAMGMADQVAVMLSGRIAQVGTPRDLYSRPATRDVAAFVGTHPINLVPGHVFGVAGEVGLRPEHLTPGAGITTRLRHVEYQGAELLLDVVTPDGTALRAVAPGDWAAPAPGAAVQLQHAPEHLHRFDATGARVAA